MHSPDQKPTVSEIEMNENLGHNQDLLSSEFSFIKDEKTDGDILSNPGEMIYQEMPTKKQKVDH